MNEPGRNKRNAKTRNIYDKGQIIELVFLHN